MPADCNCKELEPGVVMCCLSCETWVCSSCGCLDCAKEKVGRNHREELLEKQDRLDDLDSDAWSFL